MRERFILKSAKQINALRHFLSERNFSGYSISSDKYQNTILGLSTTFGNDVTRQGMVLIVKDELLDAAENEIRKVLGWCSLEEKEEKSDET
jgi:Xaa-Pro aminopeptidase